MQREERYAPLPVGPPLPGWTPREEPPRQAMDGTWARLEPLDAAAHADQLFDAFAADKTDRMWTYMFSGPFHERAAFHEWAESRSQSRDPLFFTIVDRRLGRATGLASYLRIEPVHGVIEVGHIAFAPALQRTAAATDAMYLMMKTVFDLGYRRYEWKCDTLNAASRRAALRLGFSFEGIFRQAIVYKGRNRDTAWYSVVDREWPLLDAEFRRWLEPANFDASGRQRTTLAIAALAAAARM
jgi:RimJ/RimL family protein N-acetyltransferase